MLIKSQIITQMSGSIGGVTGSHNRGGLYLRSRAIPVNPSTAAQQIVQNNMAVLAPAWSDELTQLQRDAWNLWGEQVPRQGPLGDPVPQTGIGAFVGLNSFRLQQGLERVDDGPTVFTTATMTEPEIDTVDVANQQIDVTFDTSDAWAGETGGVLGIYISRPQNAGITFFKGPYRLAKSVLGVDALPPSSPTTVDVPFPIVAGQQLFARFRVARADGRISGETRDSIIVA